MCRSTDKISPLISTKARNEQTQHILFGGVLFNLKIYWIIWGFRFSQCWSLLFMPDVVHPRISIHHKDVTVIVVSSPADTLIINFSLAEDGRCILHSKRSHQTLTNSLEIQQLAPPERSLLRGPTSKPLNGSHLDAKWACAILTIQPNQRGNQGNKEIGTVLDSFTLWSYKFIKQRFWCNLQSHLKPLYYVIQLPAHGE